MGIVRPPSDTYPQWEPLGASTTLLGISATPGASTSPTIAIDPNAGIVVAWHDDSTYPAQIRARYWDGSVWAEAGPGAASGLGISGTVFSGDADSPVLRADGSGGFHVLWRNDLGGVGTDVYFRQWTASRDGATAVDTGVWNRSTRAH